MSLLDRFRPPPGAPGAVRAGARCWRDAAGRLDGVVADVRSRSAVVIGSWEGPARSAFDQESAEVLAAVQQAGGQLHRYAEALDAFADGIEHAQAEYHQRVGMMIGTVVVGGLLTAVTATLSDEVAVAAVAAEAATVTEIAATATEQVVALLAQLAAEAAALAARWAVLTGALVTADAASGMVVHRDLDPLAHVHWAEDAQFALVGAVAAPLAPALAGGLAAASGGVLANGAAGIATRLAAAGLATAGADGLVRAALRQGVDPGELAMAALPLGGAGRGGRARPPVVAEGTVPLGFADAAEFAAFSTQLRKGLADAGYRDAVPVFQGSAITGRKYTTGQAFDVGRRSDFDIALADPALFERAKALGVPLRRNPPRSAPLTAAQVNALGLGNMWQVLTARAGRKVAFMIYKDVDLALDRAGGLVIR